MSKQKIWGGGTKEEEEEKQLKRMEWKETFFLKLKKKTAKFPQMTH